MPRNDYLWLATLAFIAAKNTRHKPDHEHNQGPSITQVTAVGGVIVCFDSAPANDPAPFLIVLCQISRKTPHSPSGFVQIQILPVFLRIPRGVWPLPGCSHFFPGAKTITSPHFDQPVTLGNASHRVVQAGDRFSCRIFQLALKPVAKGLRLPRPHLSLM